MAGRRRTLLSLIVAGCLIASASAADAADRYAAPAGSGTACTQNDPCGIQQAIVGSANGDDVTILAGSYNVPASTLALVRDNLTIHGPASGPRPVISVSDGNGIYLLGAGNAVRDLSIVASGAATGDSGLFLGGGAGPPSYAERVHVLTTAPTGTACFVAAALIRDSVCETNAADTTALRSAADGNSLSWARNVTAVARGAGSTGVKVTSDGSNPSGTVQLDARNVIASGGLDDGAAIAGIGSAAATLNFSTSVFDTVSSNLNGNVTPTNSGTNLAAQPQFVNAGASDFRQLPTSPGVDTGLTDSLTGSTDFDRNARVQGGRIDIGAYELMPEATTPTDSTPPDTFLGRVPRKKTKKAKATITFGSDERGSTFTCKVDRNPAQSCDSPLKLKRLGPGRHSISVAATDAAGNTDPTPATYRWKIGKRSKR